MTDAPLIFPEDFPEDLEKALTKIHERFNIDLNEYIIKTLRDDILISANGGNDTVLNQTIDEHRREVIALLEGEN